MAWQILVVSTTQVEACANISYANFPLDTHVPASVVLRSQVGPLMLHQLINACCSTVIFFDEEISRYQNCSMFCILEHMAHIPPLKRSMIHENLNGPIFCFVAQRYVAVRGDFD